MSTEELEKAVAKKLVRRAWLTSELYVKPPQQIIQSKAALNALEMTGGLLKGTGWGIKNLVVKPAWWLTKTALFLGVGIPSRVIYDAWHHLTKPVTFELTSGDNTKSETK